VENAANTEAERAQNTEFRTVLVQAILGGRLNIYINQYDMESSRVVSRETPIRFASVTILLLSI
jgi:hypothetical protein